MVDLLFYVLPIVCGGSVSVCITLCPFSFCNHIDDKEKASYFVLFLYLVSVNVL